MVVYYNLGLTVLIYLVILILIQRDKGLSIKEWVKPSLFWHYSIFFLTGITLMFLVTSNSIFLLLSYPSSLFILVASIVSLFFLFVYYQNRVRELKRKLSLSKGNDRL